jgi:hypothetical protein
MAMALQHATLKRIGWNQAEIDHALAVTQRSDASKPRIVHYFEHSTFWILLVLILLTNFFVAYLSLPLFVIMNAYSGLIIVVFTGLFFGTIFAHTVRYFDKKIYNHIILLVIIPVSAFVNILVMGLFAQNMARLVKLQIINPVVIAAIYSLSLLLPYLFFFIREMRPHIFAQNRKIKKE